MEEEEYDRNTDNTVSLINSSAIHSEDTEVKSFVDRSYQQETNHTSVNWDPNQNGNEIKLEFPKDHNLIEDVAVTRYRCYHCPYVTKQKGLLSRHVLIHRKSFEIRTYDCNLCPYKAKRKSHLTKHILIHKDFSEITTYDCSFCSYKAKLKSHLTGHMLIHKDASEITTYDCSFCSYKAKRKSDLTGHMLIHKDASEITTFDCTKFAIPGSFARFLPNVLNKADSRHDSALCNQMYFMHDGAPPHFAWIVREYLNEQFPGRWIGRGNDAPISWPPRAPDLNPYDIFIWGDLKQKVYSVCIENEEQLWNSIQNAVQELQNEETLRRVHFNFLRRIDFCINENGGHFEHLIKSQ
ncbi:hypothetical protein NQ318_015495 [Aromia moschata]|uniref:C2H2-type domain-containing protein n=1 Tax=Aromia moschata TaxID=1265417 RepID=A0AAV8XHR1_9CUCU|nr:hypothetical protein NQ318_015495 [Aromia moschata]